MTRTKQRNVCKQLTTGSIDARIRHVKKYIPADRQYWPYLQDILDLHGEAIGKACEQIFGIKNFGEHIGGSRKDAFTAYRTSIKTSGDDIASLPLSKSFPQPNYKELAASGVNKRALAYIAVLRQAIPPKPRKLYYPESWVNYVRNTLETVDALLSGNVDIDRFSQELSTNPIKEHIPLLVRAIEDLEPADLPQASKYMIRSVKFVERKVWVLWSPNVKNIYELDQQYGMRDPFATDPKMPYTHTVSKDEIVEKAQRIIKFDLQKEKEKAKSPNSKETKPTRVQVYGRKVGRNKFVDLFIGFKHRGIAVKVKFGFETIEDAHQYLMNNHDEIQAIIKKMREGPLERNATNRKRTGPTRTDKIVTPTFFDETFKFRGVEFGNYVELARRFTDLQDAHDALCDLAAVLNIPLKALTFNGSLALAFGARGRGGRGAAVAHYEPLKTVINLTKTRGPGSLAHEWFHALDNYLYRLGMDEPKAIRSLSEYRPIGSQLRSVLFDAWMGIVRSLDNNSYAARQHEFDKARAKEYWGKLNEKMARAFERYVVDKLAEMGITNDYLANINIEGGAYPTQGEMQDCGITAAFDKFFANIKQKEMGSGFVELYN
jgi:hypothetical protein